MARVLGVEPQRAGLLTRAIFWFARRKVREIIGEPKLVEPLRVMANHRRLLTGYAQMEMGKTAADSVPAAIKALAQLKAAAAIGCPF